MSDIKAISAAVEQMKIIAKALVTVENLLLELKNNDRTAILSSLEEDRYLIQNIIRRANT